MSKITFFLLVLLINQSAFSATFSDKCKSVFSRIFNDTPEVSTPVSTASNLDRSYVLNNHKNNTFTTGRSLSQYMTAFNRFGYPVLSLKDDLLKMKLNPNAHWLDAGGGAGFATEEAILNDSKFKATLVSVETPAVDLLDETSKDIRRKVISGKFIEDIADADLPKSDLITDLYGPMAYTSQPNKVLRKYVDNLKQDGVAYIYLGEDLDMFGKLNQIATKDGKVLSFTEWIEAIPGLKTEVVKIDSLVPDTTMIQGERSRVLKLSLTKPASEIKIPDLERLSFKEGSSSQGFVVPRMVFKEAEVAPLLPVNTSVDNSFKKVITNFRTGEFEHPLIDELENLNGGKWAHFGNEVIDWKKASEAKIVEREYYEMGTNRILSRVKNMAEKKPVPLSTLKGDQDLKLISDHNGNFLSSHTADIGLQKYLDSLSDDGTIILNLGSETTGLGVAKVIGENEINLRQWLANIPGISVKLKRTKETQNVVGRRLKESNTSISPSVAGGVETYDTTEVSYGMIAVIKIEDRTKIKIPKLKSLGASLKNEEGFEVPLYQYF